MMMHDDADDDHDDYLLGKISLLMCSKNRLPSTNRRPASEFGPMRGQEGVCCEPALVTALASLCQDGGVNRHPAQASAKDFHLYKTIYNRWKNDYLVMSLPSMVSIFFCCLGHMSHFLCMQTSP